MYSKKKIFQSLYINDGIEAFKFEHYPIRFDITKYNIRLSYNRCVSESISIIVDYLQYQSIPCQPIIYHLFSYPFVAKKISYL